MRTTPWVLAVLSVACGCSRPVPTGGGAPIGPRTVEELEAQIGESGLSLRRTVAFGFESEAEFGDFYVTPSPHLGTTRHERSTEAFTGGSSHHAWIEGTNPVVAGENTNHRGYPTVQFQKTAGGPLQGVVLIEFMAWLDIELKARANQEWFSFITTTSYADDSWPRTVLFNLDPDRLARLMHVPGQLQRTIDLFEGDAGYPLREWVRISMLLDYTSVNAAGGPYAKVWLDGQAVSAARFNPRIDPLGVDRALWPACLDGWDEQSVETAEALCGLEYAGGLAQVHLGMYAPPLISSGDVYNDELYFYELARP
ncbi:MAG: hypothetical protein M3Q39_05790 [Actinomycetota bacterium]|nr:hypothetical protein [Actinomycetota bacterium]